MKRFLINILMLLLLATPMMAQKKATKTKTTTQTTSVSSLKSQREQTLKDLEKTGQMLKETRSNEKATVNKLTILNQDIKTRKTLIANLNTEINGLDTEMAELGRQRDSLQNDLEALKADYAELVRRTHYVQKQESPLLFILSADDFQQMVRRVRYMKDFQTYRKEQVAKIQHTQQEIDEKNDQLQQNKNEKEDAVRTNQQQQEALQRDQRKQQSMLNELKKKEKDLAAQQKKQQKKADELSKKIEALIAAEVKKNPKTSLTKEQSLVAGGFEKNKGRLPWPVEKGFISGHFGTQPHPTLAKVTVNNKGIYIQTTAGAIARAVYEGEVTACMNLGGTAAIIIQHGNYRTVYAGLKSVNVKKGDKVKAKQTIGTIYSDPEQDNATRLFFQIYQDSNYINPEPWLSH